MAQKCTKNVLDCIGIVSKVVNKEHIVCDENDRYYEISYELANKIINQSTSKIPVWIIHNPKYVIGYVVNFFLSRNDEDDILCCKYKITSQSFLSSLSKSAYTRFTEIQMIPYYSPDKFISEIEDVSKRQEEESIAVDAELAFLQKLSGLSLSHDKKTHCVVELSICLAGARDLSVTTSAQLSFQEDLIDTDKNTDSDYLQLFAGLLSYANQTAILKIEKDLLEINADEKRRECLVYSHMNKLSQYKDKTNMSTQVEQDRLSIATTMTDILNSLKDIKTGIQSKPVKKAVKRKKKHYIEEEEQSDEDSNDDNTMDEKYHSYRYKNVNKKPHIEKDMSYTMLEKGDEILSHLKRLEKKLSHHDENSLQPEFHHQDPEYRHKSLKRMEEDQMRKFKDLEDAVGHQQEILNKLTHMGRRQIHPYPYASPLSYYNDNGYDNTRQDMVPLPPTIDIPKVHDMYQPPILAQPTKELNDHVNRNQYMFLVPDSYFKRHLNAAMHDSAYQQQQKIDNHSPMVIDNQQDQDLREAEERKTRRDGGGRGEKYQQIEDRINLQVAAQPNTINENEPNESSPTSTNNKGVKRFDMHNYDLRSRDKYNYKSDAPLNILDYAKQVEQSFTIQ